MKIEIVTTADGSHTLFVSEISEHYHSTYGAITESRHIFIDRGFRALDAAINPVHILEVGFGTGLNALLTYYTALKDLKKIYYVAVDPCMLDNSIFSKLNYHQFIEDADATMTLKTLHLSKCNELVDIAAHFILHKIDKYLEKTDLMNKHFHLVYFDAFAPDVQADLWTVDIFRKLFEAMVQKGILITYSAKGDVKRALKQAGFKTESLPGPIGKREITRAIKA